MHLLISKPNVFKYSKNKRLGSSDTFRQECIYYIYMKYIRVTGAVTGYHLSEDHWYYERYQHSEYRDTGMIADDVLKEKGERSGF